MRSVLLMLIPAALSAQTPVAIYSGVPTVKAAYTEVPSLNGSMIVGTLAANGNVGTTMAIGSGGRGQTITRVIFCMKN